MHCSLPPSPDCRLARALAVTAVVGGGGGGDRVAVGRRRSRNHLFTKLLFRSSTNCLYAFCFHIAPGVGFKKKKKKKNLACVRACAARGVTTRVPELPHSTPMQAARAPKARHADPADGLG